MKVYNYNQEGIYLGESLADESPLEPGIFLIPGNATEIAPPTIEQGFVPVFNGTEWEMKDISLQQTEPITGPIEEPVTENKTQAELLQEQMDTLSLQILGLMGV